MIIHKRRYNRIIVFLLAYFACSGIAWSFGSSTIILANNEHARITWAALSCDSEFEPLTKPVPCFDYKSIDNLGGEWAGIFSAVETPDNIAMHWTAGPDWWHCDGGDYDSSRGYPQTRENASQKTIDCRVWARHLLSDGLPLSDKYCIGPKVQKGGTWLCTGVASRVHKMLNKRNNIDIDQPRIFTTGSGCSFNGDRGRIKCEVLQQFGFALHAIQDFYSHSNYADINESWPFGWDNPVGIGSYSTPALWDMKINSSSAALIPDNRLSTGCYPDGECVDSHRTAHKHLNKDKVLIDRVTGKTNSPNTDRGKLIAGGITNADRAVKMAIRQTRAAWQDLQELIINKEGRGRGEKIICAIASDKPNLCTGLTTFGTGGQLTMPRGEKPDPHKIAPFKWMTEEYEAAALDSKDPVLAHTRSLSKNQASGVIGIDNPNPIHCGDRTIESQKVIPGGIGKLVAYDLVVSGANCGASVIKLRKYRSFFTASGRDMKTHPEIQCIVMTEDTTPDNSETHARIVCKNSDETIEMSFHPTCGGDTGSNSHNGDCGI